MTDSAHALGQIPFTVNELQSDFVGLNLHKWIGNPVGAGVLYVKKTRIAELKAFYGDVAAAENSISKLAHIGTTPFAVVMTIPASLAFHRQMQTARISARLHYLKSMWVKELMQHPHVEIVTPPELSCGIASFRIKHKPAAEVADVLLKQYNIFTVARTLGKEGCVRVTPAVFNSANDIRVFIDAVKKIAAA